MFRASERGFQTTFANGNTVSVQWNSGNYCANQSYSFGQEASIESATAEIAAWDTDGRWHCFESFYCQVLGHQSADEVAVFMEFVASNLLVFIEDPCGDED